MAKIDRYRDLLIRLLPKGRLWQFNAGSSNYQMAESYAVELTRLDDRTEKLLQEQDPTKAIELLEDWERDFGIPDECTGLADTMTQRRVNLVAKILAKGGQSEQYFIDLFTGLGVTIDEHGPTYVPLSVPAEIEGDAPLYLWDVYIPDAQIEWAEAEDSADDYVGYFLSSNNVACLIEKYKPAHTVAVYHYGA